MELFWNPNNHSREENSKWCQLRAIEWGKFPLFISQPFVPILLHYYAWWKILIFIILFNFLWCIIRYQFVSKILAETGVYLLKLKWPISILICIYFLFQKKYFLGVLSISWPFVTLILTMLTGPTQIGMIEKLFAYNLGLIDRNNNI